MVFDWDDMARSGVIGAGLHILVYVYILMCALV